MALLLETADAERVVVSVDHGNAFGERDVYGHPPRMLLPSLRARYAMATDRATDEPATDDRGEMTPAVSKPFQYLGYLSE